MSQQLAAIRAAYDAAVAEAEQDGAAPEGLPCIPATRELRDEGLEGTASREARILAEAWAAQQRVIVEALAPRAA